MRAILIDAYNQSIKEINFDYSDSIIKELLNCNSYRNITFNYKNNIVIDDVIYLNNSIKFGFMIDCYPAPLIGNGIIIGSNYNNGNIIDCDLDIELLKNSLEFFS